MSDFAHTFNNHGPSATLKQTLAHRLPSINYGPSATFNQLQPIGLLLLSLVYRTRKTQKSQIKVSFASSFWFEKSAFKPYFAKGSEGGTRERGRSSS